MARVASRATPGYSILMQPVLREHLNAPNERTPIALVIGCAAYGSSPKDFANIVSV